MAGCGMEFSRSSNYFAISREDGGVRFWDTDSNLQKQEYTPTERVSTSCTCIRWNPFSDTILSNKSMKTKGKKKSSTQTDLIALGARNGCVIIYSYSKGDTHLILRDGHTERVNDICWAEKSRLLSCSDDHNIVEWNLETAEVVKKWKGDKGPVKALCLCSRNRLLSANRKIKLWNVETKELLQVFTGHATEVSRLLPVPTSKGSDAAYFLSSAESDRVINAWTIMPDRTEKNAITSFTLPDAPVMMNTSTPTAREDPLVLCVVTKSGTVALFEHTLNGKLKKPLKPKVRLQVAAPGAGQDGVPQQLHIVAAQVTPDLRVLLGYGSIIKMAFEHWSYDTSQTEVCLIRDDPLKSVSRKEAAISKVKTPEISRELTVLTPAQLAPEGPAQDGSRRRKRQASVSEMPLAQRIDAMSDDRPQKMRKTTTQTDNFAQLLSQGLISKDKKILNVVLQKQDEKVIGRTVQRLPFRAILPLVEELHRRSSGHAASGLTSLKWWEALLKQHSSHLSSIPGIVELLQPSHRLLSQRSSHLQSLSALHGRFSMGMAKMDAQDEDEEITQEPLLVYNEEDSDEDMQGYQTVEESEPDWDDDGMDEEDGMGSNAEDENSEDGSVDMDNGGDEDEDADDTS